MKNRKKFITIMICFCIVFTLFGCGSQAASQAGGKEDTQDGSSAPSAPVENEEADIKTNPEKTSNGKEDSSDRSSVLIAYFSWADNAEEYNPEDIDIDALGSASVTAPGDVGVIAGYIEERTQADVFKIILNEKYSSNYNECLDQGRRQRDEGARPELSEMVENIGDYDVIFLGFPNWWYTIPVAVHSFVEAHDLSGKTIIPFVTHGTGGLAGTIQDLTEALPDDCTILQSYDVFEDDVKRVQDEVNEWLEGLGY